MLKYALVLDMVLLVIMSLFRIALFIKLSPLHEPFAYSEDILKAFYWGARLDLVFVAYIQAPITLILLILYVFGKIPGVEKLKSYFAVYYGFSFLIISLLLASDIFFFNYFGDHINLLFFGIIDDDTYALWQTFLKNYNVPLIFFGIISYILLILFMIKKILAVNLKPVTRKFSGKLQAVVILLAITVNFLCIRGTLGMYPLGRMMPDISEQHFINKLPMNGIRAFIDASKLRIKVKSGKRDLIKEMGFKDNIEQAFKIHLNRAEIDTADLLTNITYRTAQNRVLEELKPNVVVIMVESFAAPLYQYQSNSFNILGAMAKHFNDDHLFTNFCSSSNGTLNAIEALIINAPTRPGSSSYSESVYMQSSFKSAPSFVYKNQGYETSFIYGGDLSWRKIGDFCRNQGFDQVEGKAGIIDQAQLEAKTLAHDWGVFDEYLYEFILKKLNTSEQPQYMLVMTTNNHPPFQVPEHYKAPRLDVPENLKKNIIGDQSLANLRFQDYQYAVDMLGKFIDKIKSGDLAENTIIAVTADNNTLAGTLCYDTNELFQSKHIPFYLYLPTALKRKMDTSVFGSHKDIMPTLFNLSLSNSEFLAVGTNLLNPQQIHYGFNNSGMVFSNEGTACLKNRGAEIQHKSLLDYYRATIAVTEYFVKKTVQK